MRWLAWIKENDPGRGGRVWQRNYYERIIRNETELNRIREYILANPANWNRDPENRFRIAETAYDEAWSWLESP